MTLILTTVHSVYLIWKKGSPRVWLIYRGCLLLHGTWSHLWYIQRSLYAHSLICTSYRTYEIEYCSLFLSFHRWKVFDVFMILGNGFTSQIPGPIMHAGISRTPLDWLIDWLITYGFTSRSRIFHLYGDVTIAGEGLQNLGLCSALRAFEKGGIFIVPHLLFRSNPKECPIYSPLTTHEGMWRIYSNPDLHGKQCPILFKKYLVFKTPLKLFGEFWWTLYK
jgi:hypothetical protein